MSPTPSPRARRRQFDRRSFVSVHEDDIPEHGWPGFDAARAALKARGLTFEQAIAAALDREARP